MGKGDRKTKKGKIIIGTFGLKRRHKKNNSPNTITFIKRCCYCREKLIKRKIASKQLYYPSNGETDDHIPQQCLYEGYNVEFKLNRKKVLSCYKCNQKFSEIENDLRDFIGILNIDNINQEELTISGVKSILSHRNASERLCYNKNGEVIGVDFSFDNFDLNHLKNFKGIYNIEFKNIIPKEYKIKFINDPYSQKKFTPILTFLENNDDWKVSGHEDIFRYKIIPFKNINGEISKTNKLSDSIGVFSLLHYHKSLLILVIGTKKDKIIKKI